MRRVMAASGVGVLVLASCSGGGHNEEANVSSTSRPRSSTSVTEAPAPSAPATTGTVSQPSGTTAPRSSTSAPLTSTAPPGTNGSADTSRCSITDLRVTTGEFQGATGHQGGPLLFRNISHRICQLRAYPGVDGLDASGRSVAHARRSPKGFLGGLGTSDAVPPTVVLRPGETASALVEGTSVPTGDASSCPSYPSLLVIPPNETHSVKLRRELPGCSPIEIHPVVPGTSGSVTH